MKQNRVKFAFFTAFLSALFICVIGVIDAKIDFNAVNKQEGVGALQTIFYALASYIFIKVFTFYKKFSFLALMISATLFLGICALANAWLSSFLPPAYERHQDIGYALLATISFIFIFALNLIKIRR